MNLCLLCLTYRKESLRKKSLGVLNKINLLYKMHQDVPYILSIENIKRKVGRTQGPHVSAVCL